MIHHRYHAGEAVRISSATRSPRLREHAGREFVVAEARDLPASIAQFAPHPQYCTLRDGTGKLFLRNATDPHLVNGNDLEVL